MLKKTVKLIVFSSVTQSCPTFCKPMDFSMPDFPVHHQIPELAQSHVRLWDLMDCGTPGPSLFSRVGSNSRLLSWLCYRTISSFASPFSFPSIRIFSNESALRIRWPKYWSFSFSTSPSNEYSVLISFKIDWLDPAVQGTLKSLLQCHSINSLLLSLLSGLTLTSIHDYWKNYSFR